jgi:signal transduction histidine kinase
MSSTPFAESTAEALSVRLSSAQRDLARRWLDELNALLVVEKRDIFPGDQMLDHIPQLIAEIAGFVRAPGAEAIAANTAVMAKAAELGELRFAQRATVHQLLREYHLLGTLLEEFITNEVQAMGVQADPVEALKVQGRASQAVRVLQQQTVDTFVGKYSETIDRQTAQLRGFTGLISHEIRQPLGVLQMVAHLMPRSGERSDGLIDKLDRNVRRLSEVAGKLERLAFVTRAGYGESPTHQEVDLGALAHEVALQLHEMADTRGIEIIVEPELPRLTIDAGRAELAIVNLIANAIKYADPDKSTRFVRVAQNPGAARSILVTDNGIGIPAAKVAAIFESFVRAHAHRDEELGAQGLGLGLAIVRECMDAMSGTVTVTSEERVGTVFTLTWPAAPAAPPA